MKTFFSLHLGKIHKIGESKAIFRLGIPPKTGGKTGQIKSLIINHILIIPFETKADSA